jgi:hypothetical protein
MTLFHLANTLLRSGSIIEPGNWGRMILRFGLKHARAMHEMSLERARVAKFEAVPSRLSSAFAFLSLPEARAFRQEIGEPFASSILYRVSLDNPDAPSHVADYRQVNPRTIDDPSWPDCYWQRHNDLPTGADAEAIERMVAQKSLAREMLTLSALRIEERLE